MAEGIRIDMPESPALSTAIRALGIVALGNMPALERRAFAAVAVMEGTKLAALEVPDVTPYLEGEEYVV